jgi:hypothetical protein
VYELKSLRENSRIWEARTLQMIVSTPPSCGFADEGDKPLSGIFRALL